MCKIHQEDSWAGTDPGGGGHSEGSLGVGDPPGPSDPDPV